MSENVLYFFKDMKKVTELQVKGISLDKHASEPRLLLQDAGGDVTVSLGISPSEANAIITEMERIGRGKATTYDFIVDLLGKHGFSAKTVLLHSFIQDSCSAKFIYRKGFRTFSLCVRPCDAIAVAARLKVPILIPDEEKPAIKQSWTVPRDSGERNRDFLFLGQQRQAYPFL